MMKETEMMTGMMAGMSCCESPPVVSDDTQNSNPSSDLSNVNGNGSSDSSTRRKKQRPILDEEMLEKIAAMKKIAIDAYINIHGLDYEAMIKEVGPRFMDPFDSSESEMEMDNRPTSLILTEAALKFLKDTEGKDYELLKIRSVYPTSDNVTHLNFFATLKVSEPDFLNTPQPAHLFFAELDFPEEELEVVSCSIVRDYGPDYFCDADSDQFVVHPDGFVCPDCEEISETGFPIPYGDPGTDDEFDYY